MELHIYNAKYEQLYSKSVTIYKHANQRTLTMLKSMDCMEGFINFYMFINSAQNDVGHSGRDRLLPVKVYFRHDNEVRYRVYSLNRERHIHTAVNCL